MVTREPGHHRRSIRLKGYNYSQAGAYFVTICCEDRRIRLDTPAYHEIVEQAWNDLAKHYSHVQLDQFVIMPNHVHGIIQLTSADPVIGDNGAGLKPAPTAAMGERQPLSEIVRAFKSFSARRINEVRRTPGHSLWQRNYYEHVIRNEDDLHDVREYIVNNPAKWELDKLNPEHMDAVR